jgi:hypothetical protein
LPLSIILPLSIPGWYARRAALHGNIQNWPVPWKNSDRNQLLQGLWNR